MAFAKPRSPTKKPGFLQLAANSDPSVILSRPPGHSGLPKQRQSEPSWLDAPMHLVPEDALDDFFRNPFPQFHPSPDPKPVITADVREEIGSEIAHILNQISKNCPSTAQYQDFTLFSGPAGLAYMFWRISRKARPNGKEHRRLVRQAYEYIASALRDARKQIDLDGTDTVCSFLLGELGTYALASAIARDAGLADDAAEYARVVLTFSDYVLDDAYAYDDVLYGRAGYLYAALFVNKFGCPDVFPDALIEEICARIVRRGRFNALSIPLVWPWQGDMQYGAGHGVAGILHMLMVTPGFMDHNGEAREFVRSTIDYIVRHQFLSGNFPAILGQNDDQDRYIEWIHGAPGMIAMLLDAYTIFNDKRYLTSAEMAAESIWYRGLVKKGVGLCAGIAGNGYAFLQMYQVTKDDKYLHWALSFARFACSAHVKQHVWKAVERPFSLMDGAAGLCCFLSDLIDYDLASFPGFDIDHDELAEFVDE